MTHIAERVREAEERIRGHVRRTPLVRSELLSAASGREASRAGEVIPNLDKVAGCGDNVSLPVAGTIMLTDVR